MSKREERIKAANEKWAKRDLQAIEKMEKEKHDRNRKIASEYQYITGNSSKRYETQKK